MNERRSQDARVEDGTPRIDSEIESTVRSWGIDLATLRERLRMTPAKRLAANTRQWRFVTLFRQAGEQRRTASRHPVVIGREKDRILLAELEVLKRLRSSG